MPTATGQYLADWNARRRMPAAADVKKSAEKRDVVKRACTCHKRGLAGDYIDPGTYGAMTNAEAVAYLQGSVGMGSWLSKAFSAITGGTKLSKVVQPVATVVGSAVGGPVGGAIGTIVGGVASGGGGGGQQQPQQQQAPAPYPAAPYGYPPPYGYPYPAPQQQLDVGGLIKSVGDLFGIFGPVRAQQAPAPAPAPTVINATPAAGGIDQKTLLIGGAVVLAAVLMSQRR
jgi:hypothetical protein